MPREPASLVLAAVMAAAALSLPAPSWAAPPEADPVPAPKRPVPAPTPEWSHPPEAVRTATAALRDACAAWPKQLPPASDVPVASHDAADAPYVSTCDLVLDPEDFGQVSLLKGGALGAAAAGVAAVVFKAAKFLLFGLAEAVARGVNALWNRRRRRANGWVD